MIIVDKLLFKQKRKKVWKIQAWTGLQPGMLWYRLCDSRAVLNQLSYQANKEDIVLWVHDHPLKSKMNVQYIIQCSPVL